MIGKYVESQEEEEIGQAKLEFWKYHICKGVGIDKVNIALDDEGINLFESCFECPEEELTKTINAQPAILAISIILYRLLQRNNIKPNIVTGHSLGEYSALVAASSLKFSDAVKLVRKRERYIQSVVPLGTGSMVAIISLNKNKIKNLIKKVSKFGIIEIVSYNSPYQIVISGEKNATKELLVLAEEYEEINIIFLKVVFPFISF